MSAPRLRDARRLLLPVLLAAAWLPGTTGAEPDCRAIVEGALYPAEITHEDSAGYGVFRDWLCSHELTTHDQALAEGLPVGALVYGVPLRGGRSFRSDEISAWRARNCSETTPRNVARSELLLRRLAEPSAVERLEECRSDTGLRCSAELEGEFAIFRASYHEFRRTARVGILRVNGERATDVAFRKGHPLDASGIVYARKLGDARTLRFELETDEGTCSASAVVRNDRRTNRNPRGPDGSRRRAP